MPHATMLASVMISALFFRAASSSEFLQRHHSSWKTPFEPFRFKKPSPPREWDARWISFSLMTFGQKCFWVQTRRSPSAIQPNGRFRDVSLTDSGRKSPRILGWWRGGRQQRPTGGESGGTRWPRRVSRGWGGGLREGGPSGGRKGTLLLDDLAPNR